MAEIENELDELMPEKNIVVWQNSFSVGMKLIDEQHQELIKFTNRLFASCMQGQERSRSKSIFLDIIHECVDYVGYHFGTEEKVMERVNYPDYKEHKKEHTEFVREVFNQVEEFNSRKRNASLAFVYFLRDWVLHHIAVSDKKMGDYILGMQKSGALHKITLKVKKDKVTHRVQIR